MTFADRCLQLRRKLGLTQAQLAERLQVSFATVNRWEAGRCSPQRAHLKDFEALEQHGVDRDTLRYV